MGDRRPELDHLCAAASQAQTGFTHADSAI